MNCMESILSKIELEIPPEILMKLIHHDTVDEDNNITLQRYIQKYIIDKYVLRELNTQCGQTKNIELKNSYIMENVEKKYNEKVTFYQIPLSVSERPIVACRSIGHLDAEFNIQYYSKNTISSELESMLNSHTLAYEERKIRVDLLDNNIIKIYDEYISDQKLECTIGFDNNFTNISNQAIPHLCNYIISILKKHIYNTFSFSINIDRVISGVSVEKLDNILDEYKSETEESIMKEKLMDIKLNMNVYERDALANLIYHAL